MATPLARAQSEYLEARTETRRAADDYALTIAKIIPSDRHLSDDEIDKVTALACDEMREQIAARHGFIAAALVLPGILKLFCEMFRSALLRHRMAMEV